MGLAFPISEHVAIRSWAEARGLRVAVEIDRVVAGEEYEEVLAFYQAGSAWRCFTMWRSAAAVVLEPASGPSRRSETIWDAIDVAAQLLAQNALRVAPIRLRWRQRSAAQSDIRRTLPQTRPGHSRLH